jgi:hypothetical protein
MRSTTLSAIFKLMTMGHTMCQDHSSTTISFPDLSAFPPYLSVLHAHSWSLSSASLHLVSVIPACEECAHPSSTPEASSSSQLSHKLPTTFPHEKHLTGMI